MKKIFFLALSAALLVGCDKDEEPVKYPNVVELINNNPNLSIFGSAINKAGLQSFTEGGAVTWFAPSNDAFIAKGITADSVNRMSQGTASYLLTYHLLRALVTSKDMIASFSVPRTTQQGSTLYTGGQNGQYFVNGARVTSVDNYVSNGMVHIIDRVNTPVNLAGNLQSILIANSGPDSLFILALRKAGRWTQMASANTYTIIAPTDAAMVAAGLNSAGITAATVGRLDSLARYHYFNSARYFTNDLSYKSTTNPTALGNSRTLAVSSSSSGIGLKGTNNTTAVNIIKSNFLGTNGVVHFSDGILRY
jgi:uncharacterized surface protein with fasciclin (FAS1) repeats